MSKRNLVIAVDFDDTIVNSVESWQKGRLTFNKDAKESINYLHDVLKCEIIIWSCRDKYDKRLYDPMVKFLNENDVHYDKINENCSFNAERGWLPRKIYADFYIDDKGFLFESINWQKIVSFIKNYKERYKDEFI